VEITDASWEEAHHFVNRWKIKYIFTLENENASFWWITVSVDPAVISASEVGKDELRQDMVDYIGSDNKWQGSSVVNFTASSMTVKIPRGGIYQTEKGLTNIEYLLLLKKEFSRHFRGVLNIRRYYFTPEQVDFVAAQGNFLQITTTQALNQVQDRLAE